MHRFVAVYLRQRVVSYGLGATGWVGGSTGRGGRARSRIAVGASLVLKARGVKLRQKVDAFMALVADVCARVQTFAGMLAAGESWAVVPNAIVGLGFLVTGARSNLYRS